MTVAELLVEVEAAGVMLRVNDAGDGFMASPRLALSNELEVELRRRKWGVLTVLIMREVEDRRGRVRRWGDLRESKGPGE